MRLVVIRKRGEERRDKGRNGKALLLDFVRVGPRGRWNRGLSLVSYLISLQLQCDYSVFRLNVMIDCDFRLNNAIISKHSFILQCQSKKYTYTLSTHTSEPTTSNIIWVSNWFWIFLKINNNLMTMWGQCKLVVFLDEIVVERLA